MSPTNRLPDHVATQLDRRLRDAQIGDRLPSVVAAIFDGDGAAWVGRAGLVDGREPAVDTQYRVGSITKTVVAVQVMRMRDEGLLDLDDPLSQHIPDGASLSPDDLGRATIGQMLMHAAGTPAETVGPWWERAPGGDLSSLLEDLAGRPPAGKPSRRFHYSNVGFGLLGAVIEHHRGRSWESVIDEEILTPLGMDRTSPRPVAPAAVGTAVHPWAEVTLAEPEHDAGAMSPAGQLWASITDLIRWGRFLGGATDEVLAVETLTEMGVPGVVDHRPGEPWTTAHGLGIQVFNVDGVTTVGHGGSMPGFLAGVRTDPDGGSGVAVMANTTSGMSASLGGDLLDLAGPHMPDRRPVWQPKPTPTAEMEIVGVWYWGPRPQLLRSTGDGLHLGPMSGQGRASRFVPTDDGWIGLDGYYAGEPLRVVRTADGHVRHLDLASFIFTRTPYDPAADVPGGVDSAGWQ